MIKKKYKIGDKFIYSEDGTFKGNKIIYEIVNVENWNGKYPTDVIDNYFFNVINTSYNDARHYVKMFEMELANKNHANYCYKILKPNLKHINYKFLSDE